MSDCNLVRGSANEGSQPEQKQAVLPAVNERRNVTRQNLHVRVYSTWAIHALICGR